jgi:SAM-dependent methyltransferase
MPSERALNLGVKPSESQRQMHPDPAVEYEARAQEFLRARDASMIGSQVVAQWASTLAKGASVIELGCGGGYPITRALHAAGLRLWAIDSSPTLVAEFERRFPSVPVKCAKAQDSDFFGRTYDAAIAAGLMFLLPEQEQLALIGRVANILAPGGRFLFTAPIEAGSWTDINTGIPCLSLGRARYEACLQRAGFRVAATLIDQGENNYYDAERTPVEHPLAVGLTGDP